MLDLIKKIKELENTKGQPFNSVKLKKARKELTDSLLKEKKEIFEIENYVLKIGYTNKDRARPYTMIFTKQSFESYKNYSLK